MKTKRTSKNKPRSADVLVISKKMWKEMLVAIRGRVNADVIVKGIPTVRMLETENTCYGVHPRTKSNVCLNCGHIHSYGK